MAYVALSPIKRADLVQTAERRWAVVSAARPDLEPAVALQRRLLGAMIDLSATFDNGRLPRLSLPPRYLAAKLSRGVPVLTDEPIPLPVPVIKPTLRLLCDALAAGGAGGAATHIRESIDAGHMDVGSLLAASLRRDQPAPRIAACRPIWSGSSRSWR